MTRTLFRSSRPLPTHRSRRGLSAPFLGTLGLALTLAGAAGAQTPAAGAPTPTPVKPAPVRTRPSPAAAPATLPAATPQAAPAAATDAPAPASQPATALSAPPALGASTQPASAASQPQAPAAATSQPATDAIPAPENAPVDVNIDARPFWASVFIAGEPVGTTPVTVALSPGHHVVTAEEPDTGRIMVMDVVVRPDAADEDAHRLAFNFDTGAAQGLGGVVPTVRKAWPPEPAAPAPLVNCPENIPCLQQAGFAIWPRMRLRAAFELQQPDRATLLLGNNDGFFVDQARLGFSGSYKNKVNFSIVMDGAAFLPDRAPNTPVQAVRAAVIDAFIHYAPFPFFEVWLGQTFMPGDREGTTSRGTMIFTDRSVASGGIRPGRYFETGGLSVNRDIGLVMGARDLHIGPLRLEYLFATGNGNGGAVFGNDNKLPALYTRLGAGFERYVHFGFGGHYNPRTTGDIPNQFFETDAQLFADLTLSLFGFNAVMQGIARQTTSDSLFADPSDPNRSDLAYGATAWAFLDRPFGVSLLGFKPGARVSYYEPTRAYRDNTLAEGTIGVRYDPETYALPIAVMIDATTLIELNESGIGALDNNRLTLLAQLNF